MFTFEDDDKKKRPGDAADAGKTELNLKGLNGGDPFKNPFPFKKDGESRILSYDELKELELRHSDMSPEKRSMQGMMSGYRKMFMPGKYTPEMGMRDYAVSERAAMDVADSFYNDNLKAVYENYKEEAGKMGYEKFKKTLMISGANLHTAAIQQMKVQDPVKLVDRVLEDIDVEKLKEYVAPLAEKGGFDSDKYINEYIKPILRDKMVRELVGDFKPEGGLEYVARSAVDNSLLGKGARLIWDNVYGLDNYSSLNSEGLANYDANGFEDLMSGVGSLVVDAPAFLFLGAGASKLVGGATKMATGRVASRVMAGRVGVGMTPEYATKIAERSIINRLGTKILQSSMTQGITLGGYDFANSVVDDILSEGNVDLGKAAGSFGKGFAVGATLGAVGTPLRHASAGLTGGKKLLAHTGILSAESAVFTGATQLEKYANGIEIVPIDLLYDFGESAATLGMLKMPGAILKGAKMKLDRDGRLKKEFQLTKSEMAELKELNVDPEEFMAKIEKQLNLPSFYEGKDINSIKEDYMKLMTDKEVSASTRAKLMFIVENKLTSTPPAPFGYLVSEAKDGTWLLTFYDFEGQVIEKMTFDRPSLLKNKMLVERGKIRKNRITACERELTHGLDSQNFIRQAGIYAKEKGIDVNEMAEILYNKASGKELTGTESFIVEEIKRRAAYDENGVVRMLADKRRELETKYGLEEGSMLYHVDEPFYECSASANAALDEYAKFVIDEVMALKKGTDAGRKLELLEKGLSSEFYGMSNDEVKWKELDGYFERKRETEEQPNIPVTLTKVKDNENGYVWNSYNYKNTPDDIAEYRKYAEKLGERFGYKLEFISDEHEVPLPDVNDRFAVQDYNNQLRAMGWVGEGGKVYINLPNMKSLEDVETTVVHEVVGHSGLLALFGNHLNDFLEEVYVKANGEVLRGINKLKLTYHGFDNYTVVEEYLAHLVEKVRPSLQERSLLAKFKDFIKGMLLRLNIYTGKNRRVSEKELVMLMKKHADYMAKRRSPADYRSKLFSRFKSANLNENTYTDRSAYLEDIKSRADAGTYLANTPEFLLDRKAFLNYDLLPEKKKAELRRKWEVSDNFVMGRHGMQKYRFVGEKGARNMAHYDGLENGDVDLREAVELERQGYSPAEIKRSTGWEPGADGKWRKEMTDNRLELKDYFYEYISNTDKELAEKYLKLKGYPKELWNMDDYMTWDKISKFRDIVPENVVLEDVMYDPSFKRAYPELMSLPVKFVKNPYVPVRYDSKEKQMVVDRNIFYDPKGKVYMAGALQNLIQDYEGFSKAVSMNLVGMNSKLKERYDEAMDIIRQMETAKRELPGFDTNSALEITFQQEYGQTPENFKKMFPTFDEYVIYKLTRKNISFSGDVEMRNVMERFNVGDDVRRSIPAEVTEDVPRSRQVPLERISDLKKFLDGPLDLIYRQVRGLHSDEPIKVDPHFEPPVRRRLHPVERGDYEVEFDDYYKKKIIDMYMKDPDRFKYDAEDSDVEYDQYRWVMDKLIRDYIRKDGKDLPN